jgi:hypothetical protein
VLEQWASNQAMFNLYMAKSLPKVEIVDVKVAAARAAKDSATHELRVTVRNTGRLPTALEQAKMVKIVRPDRVVAEFARDSKGSAIGRAPEFWLGGNQTQTITLRVKAGADPADRKLTVRLLSTRGGVAARDVTLP